MSQTVPALTFTRRRSGMLPGALAAAISLSLAAGIAAWIAGWRLHVMSTPSMGTAAPVGSVVISRPVAAAALRVGEIIVFHPPGQPDVAFAHRIYSVSRGPDGLAIRTKGDINAVPDTWTLSQTNLVGASVAVIPDLGFLIELLPFALLGTFIILLATSGLQAHHRGPARNAGAAIVAALLFVDFHPFERVVLLDEQVTNGRGIATIVPTGVLPIRAVARGGSAINVEPGQVGVVHVAHIARHGMLRITTSIHLSGWWWLALLGLAIPMLVAMRQRGGDQAVIPGLRLSRP